MEPCLITGIGTNLHSYTNFMLLTNDILREGNPILGSNEFN